MNLFRLKINVSDVADKLRLAREVAEEKVTNAVESLSVFTHAFIINKANETFKDSKFKREYYLGLGTYAKDSQKESTSDQRIDNKAKNVRWIKIEDGIWMIELDEKAEWLEEGREPTFMGEWLLKPGADGVKTAKDGSRYRAIPFKQMNGRKPAEDTKPLFAELIKKQAKRQGISLTKIEKNEDKSPKLGILHKLNMTPTMPQELSPGLYSKPRDEEEARETGLAPHGGIYKLKGAVVVQRKTKKGKIKKETVVFRVISTKHKGHRWMYPKVSPANIFPQAYDWALKKWEKMIEDIEREINQ